MHLLTSRFSRTFRQWVAPVVAGAVLLSLAGVNAANAALPGGAWGPLSSVSSGDTVTQARGTFRGIVEDQDRGTRAETYYNVREVMILMQDRRGAYMKSNYYFDARRCYVSSFQIPGGAGVTCSSGWWSWGGTQGASIRGLSWPTQRYMWKALNPSGNSVRFQMYACLDRPLAPDLCSSGSILRGAAY